MTFCTASGTSFSLTPSLQFLNGDALRETFTHTESASPFGGPFGSVAIADIHLTITIFVFMYVVVNCTVALVEEAFFITRTGDAQRLVRASRLARIYVLQTVSELLGADAREHIATK